jgi:hypothetical protein
VRGADKANKGTKGREENVVVVGCCGWRLDISVKLRLERCFISVMGKTLLSVIGGA